MGRNMGFGNWTDKLCKRKNRWLFYIDEGGSVVDDGTNALVPIKSARPSLTFKETEAIHLNENIYFPSRPEWKPITITLFDLKGKENKITDWLKQCYDPETGDWNPPCDGTFKKRCKLELYDGCGEVIETWIFDSAWPQVIEWGELDMAESSVVTIDITLRYDRAYRRG